MTRAAASLTRGKAGLYVEVVARCTVQANWEKVLVWAEEDIAVQLKKSIYRPSPQKARAQAQASWDSMRRRSRRRANCFPASVPCSI